MFSEHSCRVSNAHLRLKVLRREQKCRTTNQDQDCYDKTNTVEWSFLPDATNNY